MAKKLYGIYITFTCPHCGEVGHRQDLPDRVSLLDAQENTRFLVHNCASCHRKIVLEYEATLKARACKIDRVHHT